MGAKISLIEYYFPENKLTNEMLMVEFPDYDFSNFESKVGIKNRYIASKDTTALDLAEQACIKLFKRFDKNKVDYIIYCTQSPEYFLPTTACILQNRLKLNIGIGAFDFNLGCSGYTYGLSLAKSLITSGQAKNVLLVTAETYSKFLHPKDRSNRAIFGDAATATIISYDKDDSILEFLFGTDGSGYDKLIVKNGGSKQIFDPLAPEITYGTDNTYTDNHLYMNGPEIFNFTGDVIPAFTLDILNKNNKEKDDINQYIFHQANAFMLHFIRKKLKIDKEKFYVDLEDGGNTVSCTIPIALKKYAGQISDNKTKELIVIGFR